MNRIFLYCSTFLAGYLIFVIILLLEFFGFLNLDLSLMFTVSALYEIAIVLGTILIMLYFGAVVNQ